MTPEGTGEQVPAEPIWLQDTQGPLQAELQQTPLAQKPEAHSAAAAQAVPFAFLATQRPLSQTKPIWQSALVVQLAPQLDPTHTFGAQLREAGGKQVPAPSQTRAENSVEPMQAPGAHSVPDGAGRQAPSEPISRQDWQAPLQLLEQQTPSTQNPELHWAFAAQGEPLGPLSGGMSGGPASPGKSTVTLARPGRRRATVTSIGRPSTSITPTAPLT